MSNLYLRKTELSDVDLYYEWANDPVVRSHSFNTAHIPYEDHVNWFNKVLKRDDIVLFVLMEDDKAVGQIRISITDAKGYGGKIVSLLIERIKDEMPDIKTVSARVKPDNAASLKVFEREGFAKKEVVFELNVRE